MFVLLGRMASGDAFNIIVAAPSRLIGFVFCNPTGGIDGDGSPISPVQVELPPAAETVRHDHADDGAEDVYAVLHGTGVVVVDGQEVPVRPGQFIAVTPESTRHVRAGDSGLIFIAVCAAST